MSELDVEFLANVVSREKEGLGAAQYKHLLRGTSGTVNRTWRGRGIFFDEWHDGKGG